jgi:hypothetical protein
VLARFYGQCKADDKHEVGQLDEIFTKYTNVSNLFNVKCIRAASTETLLSGIRLNLHQDISAGPAPPPDVAASGGGSTKTEFKYWVNNTDNKPECNDIPAGLENGNSAAMSCVLCNMQESQTPAVATAEYNTCRSSDLEKITFNEQSWGKSMADKISELIQAAATLLQLKCAYKTLQY